MAKHTEPDRCRPVRFVVLRHTDSHGTHFDLMIEHGQALATWKLPTPPELAGAAEGLSCDRLADHRHVYLDYEGPLSGGRGDVARHDQGTCVILSRTPERWKIQFSGDRLRGTCELVRAPDEGQSWVLLAVER